MFRCVFFFFDHFIQARRTGSSSPLGLLFDHGCDAINCCFGVVFVSSILDAGASLPLLAAIVLNQVGVRMPPR